MDESPHKIGAMVAGFLVGGAGGFVATEAGSAFFHFVLGITPDVGDTPALIAIYLGVPVLFAVVGAVTGLRLAARGAGRGR